MNIHVKELIKELKPKYYFWENPRAGLRKMTFMQDIPRYTITYCQYMMNEPWEKRRMKPTDIWTNHPNPKFKPPCKNGELISMDGDTYDKEDIVSEYKEWNKPEENIRNGLTVVIDIKR